MPFPTSTPLQALSLPVAAIFGGIGLLLVGLALREVWLAVRYRSRPADLAS